MKIHPDITLDLVLSAAKEESHLGFCTNCGEEAHGVEPDARGYVCDTCKASCVYGAEELLLEMA